MIAGNLKVVVCLYPWSSGSTALSFLLCLAGGTCLRSYYTDTGCFPESSHLQPEVSPTPRLWREAHRQQCVPCHPCPMLTTALFQEEDDYDVMQDPEFLQSVLENLPGVDPNNEAIRNAMGSLASQATKDGKKEKKEEDKK